MLETLKKFIHTHKILLIFNFAIVVLFFCLRNSDNSSNQAIVENLRQTIVKEKISRQCESATTRLLIKIASLNKSGSVNNMHVIVSVIADYNVALRLATENDIRCILMETMGDSTLEAYKAGVSDGYKQHYGSL